MEVNKIIKISSTMLQLKEIEEIFRNVDIINDVDNDDLELLLNCVNLVCNTIATDYINLTKSVNVDNTSGVVAWKDISENQIYKILKVKNCYGQTIPFRAISDGVECEKGNVKIIYSYFPKDYEYNTEIIEFNSSLTERIFAMGVVSEYLFIRGNSNDASIWEDRFKNAMRNVVRTQKEIVLPKRRWW